MSDTRYILAGGKDLETAGYAKKLSEALKDRKKDKVLSCFFSKPEFRWLRDFNRFKPFFDEVFPESKVELALPEKFLQQLKDADVVYLHGGESDRLMRNLSEYKSIEDLFNGKTIIGSSAGANYLSTTWWSYGLRQAGKGSGITPLHTIVHYGSTGNDVDHRGPVSWDQAVKDVTEQAGKGAKITPIPEGELVVYDK